MYVDNHILLLLHLQREKQYYMQEGRGKRAESSFWQLEVGTWHISRKNDLVHCT